LDGNTLTTAVLCQLSSGELKIALKEETWDIIKQSRKVVDDLLESKKTVYGINTGFGKFATVKIPTDSLE
jgi:histidine ammonia-lyase